ncbi:hypothetical protein IMZ11_17975 [Microtetraspora sp. AC03309]|uniref:hypothetical protein n=1 Tax=Microtetraspora sp. AC03309 TaxID=2779376 RepID=UPI001E3E7F06|nr:hypothetical protein [Microtetraspora sp. AC03309]MCC5577515.1 hypothetical protein [Microtetraspora sp. AC03309]
MSYQKVTATGGSGSTIAATAASRERSGGPAEAGDGRDLPQEPDVQRVGGRARDPAHHPERSGDQRDRRHRAGRAAQDHEEQHDEHEPRGGAGQLHPPRQDHREQPEHGVGGGQVQHHPERADRAATRRHRSAHPPAQNLPQRPALVRGDQHDGHHRPPRDGPHAERGAVRHEADEGDAVAGDQRDDTERDGRAHVEGGDRGGEPPETIPVQRGASLGGDEAPGPAEHTNSGGGPEKPGTGSSRY